MSWASPGWEEREVCSEAWDFVGIVVYLGEEVRNCPWIIREAGKAVREAGIFAGIVVYLGEEVRNCPWIQAVRGAWDFVRDEAGK